MTAGINQLCEHNDFSFDPLQDNCTVVQWIRETEIPALSSPVAGTINTITSRVTAIFVVLPPHIYICKKIPHSAKQQQKQLCNVSGATVKYRLCKKNLGRSWVSVTRIGCAEQSFRRGTGCQVCSWSPAGEHRLSGAGWCGTRCHLEFSLPRLVHQGSTASWVQVGQVEEVSHYCWHGATGKCKPCGVASLHWGISEIRSSYTSQKACLKPSSTSRLTELWKKFR